MSDIFAGDSLIDIEINYIVQKNSSGVANVTVLEDDKAAEMKAGPEKDKVKTLRTKWRPQTWESGNDLWERCTSFNFQSQKDELNWNKFRSLRLKTLLVEWDCRTDKGDPIPCVEANINKLSWEFGLALLRKYDKTTSTSPETDQKN